MVVFLCIHSSAFAAGIQWTDSPAVAAMFRSAGVAGTFVLYDPARDRYVGCNEKRAAQRFVPASTFKLANSLIGLSVGAVANVDETLPFGGQSQPVKAWEKDMGLREAIRLSNVPIYQELARRIGLAAMRHALTLLQYGNEETGDKVDRFWLEGPLMISALEQARFCAALGLGTLPFPKEMQAAVRQISLVEQGDGWALFAKTGAAGRSTPPIGWWVGWLQKGEAVYAFALNMDMNDYGKDLPKRAELGRNALAGLKLLP